jgi:ABC-type glycerol-3-phosphate transport system substrate-binding protein
MRTFRARVAAAITAALALAACGEKPASITAPETASFDGGGFTFGGGNHTDTTTTTTAPQGGDAVVNGGGLTFGGGN